MLSSPTVSVRRGSGILDLFWRGADNGIEAKSWVPGSGWTDVNTTQLDPGATLSAPAAVSRNSGMVDVIVRGTDDHLYLNAYNGSGWSGWAEIPGGMTTQHAPAAIVRTLNTIDVFVRSAAGEVRWITWDGAAWSGWKTVPGGVDSGPGRRRRRRLARCGCSPAAAATWSTTSTTPARGPENGWDGWKLLHPPPPAPPPPPACDLAAGRLTAHAKLVRFGKRPRLAGRARRTDGAPLVSADDHGVARARRLDAHRHRGRQRLLRAAAAARPDPPDRRQGARARRELASRASARSCAPAPA